MIGWRDENLAELGERLAQCSSIASLGVDLYRNAPPFDEETRAVVKRFFEEGIANMRSLTHVDLSFGRGIVIPLWLLDAVITFAHNRGRTLDHFAIDINHHPRRSRKNYEERWRALGFALETVKSLALSHVGQAALSMVLPQLKSCESLHLSGYANVKLLGPILLRFPTLRTFILLTWYGNEPELFDSFLDVIKASNSITKAVLEAKRRVQEPPNFRVEVESYCLLNKVFGTTLIGYDPTDLWAGIVTKVPSDSARTNLLYRLLREKPELVIGCTHIASRDKKRQRCDAGDRVPNDGQC